MFRKIAPACFVLFSSCASGALTATPSIDPLPIKLRITRGDLTAAVPLTTQRRSTYGWRSLVDLQAYISLGGIFGIEPNGSGLRLKVRW